MSPWGFQKGTQPHAWILAQRGPRQRLHLQTCKEVTLHGLKPRIVWSCITTATGNQDSRYLGITVT